MPIARVAWIVPLAGLTGALVAGCYSYVPLQAPAPAPGLRVAADLTDSASARLGVYLGRNAASVSGRVVSVTPDDLAISVNSVRSRDGQVSDWTGETVTLPRTLVADIKQRRLAKGSTLLVGGLFTAALVVVVNAVTGGIFGSEEGGGSQPGQ